MCQLQARLHISKTMAGADNSKSMAGADISKTMAGAVVKHYNMHTGLCMNKL
jgi:hypothetical protein